MRYVTAALLTLVMTVAAGCGLAGKAVEKATEKATEKAIEKATGASVDQDKNSVSYKGSDGQQVTVTATEDGKLPEGFPIPVFKGGKVVNSGLITVENKKAWTAEIEINAEPKDVAEYYEKLVKDRGIQVNRIESNNNGESSVMLMGESGTESVMLTISRNGTDPTTMTVLWSMK